MADLSDVLYARRAADTARATLDSYGERHEERENDPAVKPAGWPDACASCGARWTEIGFDNALGFNCRACGGSDADE